MSDPVRIMLVGASGMVGRGVIGQAVGHAELRLIGLARREVVLPAGALMEVHLSPIEGWAQEIVAIAPSHVICALGTTIAKQRGDKAAFVAIDRDLVFEVARQAKQAGARGFVAVSSVGADAGSKSFYLRTKGEMEAGLARIGFARLDILRPGLLRGQRVDDLRPLERMGALIAPLADAFLHGERSKYHSVRGTDVAAAALRLCFEQASGRFVHQHDEIVRHAARWR